LGNQRYFYLMNLPPVRVVFSCPKRAYGVKLRKEIPDAVGKNTRKIKADGL
jgi:hypothetical protein